jgi:hypothetical protein
VLDPNERRVFKASTSGRLRRQTGISEMFFASEPTHLEREMAWVDGHTRRALINLPGSVTSLAVPPEFLVPGASYEFEILAIEASGNSSISVGEFDVGE